LGPATLGHRETPDGLLEFKHGPDPTDEIVEAIDNYLEQLKLVRIGRKTSAVPHAVRKVNSFVDRHNPELTSTRRQDLCHYLFDKTRERHGQHSRSPTRDDDDMPRFRDLFSKRSTRPRRKISKKEG
jgi:hypothetical protein